MKERFETIFRKEREYAMAYQLLAGPKQTWSEERPKDNGRDEIGSQSGCVFQAC
jgi:hypothetical protein